MTKDLRFKILIGIIVIAVLIICYYLLNRSEADQKEQSTEDAYVQADATTVAAQISGTIEQVAIQDNQFVKVGESLLKIDDREIQVELKNAQANLNSQIANAHKLKALIAQQQSLIQQAQANLNIDQSGLKLAQQDYQRFSNLAADGSGTVQAKQQAEAQLQNQQGQYQKNNAALSASKQQIPVLQADLEKANADIIAAKAAIDALQLKLSYTDINAPISGFINQKTARVGGYAQTGTPLLTIVPLNSIYIEANFRETQLSHMCAGQKVDIHVDALPQTHFNGTIESLGAASGASMSAIAPHNATGNFTKIVQRLPVRIHVNSDQPNFNKLRVGMSVRPVVHIDLNKCA
ncbi:HlyD family secretion protein [Acinetobacter populi]|uniref:Efflux transporter periplasmic adaptor subunit n=1 Tax=Acinetobacter populi TaxID=1582270 RepID=A0A1Z9YXE4_9GAMM|nr:HlyD family secretion protein [Acinetobacter populi]OUY06868.1 efflux transporter periplasmic adaptor subunit [Acinetobacter populi]